MLIIKEYKQNVKKIIAFLVILISFIVNSGGVFAQGIDIELHVGECNNNNVCESGLGEHVGSCPNDCYVTPPVTPGPSAGGQGTSGFVPEVFLTNLEVNPDTNSAIIKWFTNRITVGTLRWGTTLDYEIGSVSEINYTYNHIVKLQNLISNTNYYFRIDAVDTLGQMVGVSGILFSTLSIPDTTAPANVTNLTVIPKTDSIQLQWINPKDADFDSVRIVRSTTFYPQDPFQGKVVYEGRGNYVTDFDVLSDTNYYYTVFSKDIQGNYSSGAVGVGKLLKILIDGTTIVATTSDPFIDSVQSKNIDPKVQKIGIIDFDFNQDGKKISFIEGVVNVKNQPTSISVDYDKFPEHLKSIGVTIIDPYDKNKKFSFLLKSNKDKTAYEATIGSFSRGGTYPFEIVILDYNNQALKKVKGSLVVPQSGVSNQEVVYKIVWKEKIYGYIWPIIILILILIALILICRILYRKFFEGKRKMEK